MDYANRSFDGYRVAWWELLWGIILLVFVTSGVTIQAFAADTMGDAVWHSPVFSDDIRMIVFAAHVATLVFVIGEVAYGHGVKAFYGHFTIGSGIFATLSQVSLVAMAANNAAFAASFIVLGLQCFANALMLAIIIADLKLTLKKNTKAYNSIN